jgi:hypothetical protein
MSEPCKLEDWLAYDESSPSFLRWKRDVKNGKGYTKCFVFAGDVAGTPPTETADYWVVGIRGKMRPAHQIVWEMFNGKIPTGLVIDHIDGCKTNNHISNLRVVPRLLNARNAKMNKLNTSGVSGVWLNVKKGRKGESMPYWCAQWRNLEGKLVCRYFSVLKFGNDEAFRMACKHRQEMIEELNRQGAQYTERHGK